MYFMSMDKGYWAGNFGPTVSDAAFIIDYTIPLTLDPALDMVFTQPDLMFDLPPIPHMPPPLDDFSPMESASLESEVPVIEAPRMSAAPVSEPSLMKDEPTVEKTEGVASEPMRDTAQNTTEQKVEQVVVSVGDKNASMETVAAAIGSSYDPVAQSVALSIMTGTEKFEDTFLEDVAFYAPTAIVDKRIADRIWGSLFADDKRWNEMVDSQYEYGN
jgi:hypothetical protein